MSSNTNHELATELAVAHQRRLWGVSPESVYAALDACVGQRSLETALSRYRRIELAATNEERAPETVVAFHRWLLRELGLVEAGTVTEVGALVLCSENPRECVQTLTVGRWQDARRLIRECLSIDDRLPRREYDSWLRNDWEENVLTPLLGSFGLLTVSRDGVEVAESRVRQALEVHNATSTAAARSALYQRVLTTIMEVDDATAADITSELLDTDRIEETSSQEVLGTLGSNQSRRIDRGAILEAVTVVKTDYERASRRITRLITAEGGDREPTAETPAVTRDDVESTPVPVSKVLDVVATVIDGNLDRLETAWIVEYLDTGPYTCFRALNAVPGFECELIDDTLKISQVPPAVEGSSQHDEYIEYLLEEYAAILQRIDSLADPTIVVTGRLTEANLVSRLDRLRDRQVAPTYFTYTLVDPESLGEEVMDDYVGDSRGLRRERVRLRRWHETRSSGLRSYTAMTDRLFSLGLEEDLDHRVLRVMTPFDDDTFSEYAAQLRRLLERGYELRLLTRHTKEPWEWRRLRDNLLKQLESNRENVRIRTYSRFKTHQRISQDTDVRKLSEIGIHGKLHIIGAPYEGAALLGSANFMENSYHWNPECGVYTEQSAFIDAATEFFDIVWELSDADDLSLDRLQEIPERRFIPSYYS